MLYKQNHRLASAYIIASGFMFALMGAGIKLVSNDVGTELVVFFRNLFGFIVILPFVLRNGVSGLRTKIPLWHIARSLAGLGAMYCFFYSIAHIPLSESVLLSYTTPLFAPILAYLFLRETVTRSLIYAIMLGFVGVTFLLNPDFETFSWVALVALCSGMFAALAMICIRRMSTSEPASLVIFYYGLICTAVSAIPLMGIPVVDAFFFNMSGREVIPLPDNNLILILFGVGVFATLGQFCLTRGYSMAAVAQVGPFMYSTVVFATVLGWFFWQEMPTLFSAFGIILVVIAGSIALRKSGVIVASERN